MKRLFVPISMGMLVSSLWLGLPAQAGEQPDKGKNHPSPFMPAVSSFQVHVPQRVSALQTPLDVIEVVVDLRRIPPTPTTTNPAFKITQPGGECVDITIGPGGNCTTGTGVTPCVGAGGTAGGGIFCYTFADGDNLKIEHIPGIATAPDRYKITIFLNSNYDLTGGCFTNLLGAAGEDWQIEITNTTNFEIAGACVSSYELGPSCAGSIQVTDNNPAQIVGFPGAGIGCAFPRIPVDVMLVLDKSGSMGWPLGGSGATPKINSLYTAVQNFVGVWDDHEVAGDRIGVVLFNHDASDWTFGGATPLAAGLNSFTDALATEINTNVSSIAPGGATSIGDGLLRAADFLDNDEPTHRKVILLMSNGMQNTERMAAVTADVGDADGDGSTTDQVVVTHLSDGSDVQILPGINKLNFWTVSVGAPATDIDPTIFNDIASTGVGFYTNSEVTAADLNLYFLELLQNFLRFNTIETTRLISGEIPIIKTSTGAFGSTKFNVATSSTAKKITFCLMWNPNIEARVVMQVTPPQGAAIDSRFFESGPGFRRMTVSLPLPDPYPTGSHIGDWVVNVGVQGGQLPSKFPFQFYALVDDDVVKSTFDIEKRDYVTGDPIPLRVSLKEFGLPILNPGNKLKVVATLIKPGQGVGDLLSESSATGAPPSADDPLSPTGLELFNLLQQHPDTLRHRSDVITLFDDGAAAHGDAKAGDGVYSNLYTQTQEQGHYNFLFGVEGPTQHTGPISRQQIQTVYVRLRPEPSTSAISGTIIGSGEARRLRLTMGPRDKFGNRFGPGYQNYFLVSSIFGRQVKFQDNDLNGVYDLDVAIPGTSPVPPINIQYVKPFMVITDQTDPARIPADLKQPFIVNFVPEQPVRARYLSLHAGINFPHGDFDKAYDGNASLAADVEYALVKNFSLLLFAGYNKFDATRGSNLKVINASANGKLYLTSGPLRLFVNAGGGNYWFDPGTNHAGFNLGSGLQLRLSPVFALEGWYNYHNVNTSGTATQFSTVQAGFNIRF